MAKRKPAGTARKRRAPGEGGGSSPFDRRALRHLTDLLEIEGVSGDEARVAEAVRDKLVAAGVSRRSIGHDRAHESIPGDFRTGNLIVKLPGTFRAPRRLLAGHLDTVPLCRGAKVARRGDRLESEGATALGADNRTAVACIVSVLEEIVQRKLPHPPLTALFTVAEEVGLQGAKRVKISDLGRPRLGINIDSGAPYKIIVGAVGAERWEAHVHGISSHAGVHPEHGVSAALIASRAIADVAERGYFGKILKARRRGTSNVGSLNGGEATNQVTDYVHVRGESRSHDPRFAARITGIYRSAFERAAKSVKNTRRDSGRVRFSSHVDYSPFRLSADEPVVQLAFETARELGGTPETIIADGGLDASALNAKGIPTITVGAGQHGAHTTSEYVDLDEYFAGCRFVLELATRRA